MQQNHYLTIGRFMLLEYLRNPATLNERIYRNCAGLAEVGFSPLSKNGLRDFKSVIDTIVSRRIEWIRLMNDENKGYDDLGEVVPGGIPSVTGGTLYWQEVILYDLIGRAVIDCIL